MKKRIFLIAFLLTVATVTSCEDDGNSQTEPDCVTVEPITPDLSIAEKLDEFFMILSYELGEQGKGGHYVINTQEELNAIDPVQMLQGIDFEQYTLVGGCFQGPFGDTIKNVKMCENVLEQKYTLTTSSPYFGAKGPINTGMSYIYYWRLYPKLNSEFAINYLWEKE